MSIQNLGPLAMLGKMLLVINRLHARIPPRERWLAHKSSHHLGSVSLPQICDQVAAISYLDCGDRPELGLHLVLGLCAALLLGYRLTDLGDLEQSRSSCLVREQLSWLESLGVLGLIQTV